MPWVRRSSSGPGHYVMAFFASAALSIGLADYFSPDGGAAASPGTLLVCGASAALVVAGSLMSELRATRPQLHGAIATLSILGVAGTALVALLLMRPTIMAFMAGCFLGLLMHLMSSMTMVHAHQNLRLHSQ